jgi:hypothetical protein
MAVYLHFVCTLYCLVFRYKNYSLAFVPFIQALPPVQPASHPRGTAKSFLRGTALRVKLTTPLHLVLSLRMCENKPLFAHVPSQGNA